MIQITLPLVWLTIRIDVVHAARRRAAHHRTPPPLSWSETRSMRDALRASLNPHLLRDVGLDESGSG
ncbi:MAG: hypothetical protein ABW026_14530 [Microvirga sp.]